ncbi:MAG TPA: ATP phosphoribosyltransferase [Polyangiaceae bacterium]|nr:ATP phosphoribosyltransferase [Polyangiaceae bacterium]
MKPVTIAVPKGRIAARLVPLFERAGLDCACLKDDDRTLVRTSADGQLRFLLLKPDDVPTYVEYGAADLGVGGRDTLLERGYHLYQLVDLGIGKCRMVVAARAGASVPELPRVATKYTHIARQHYAARGIQPEIIYLQGSVELGPIVGLSDVIVDLVETGSTLVENNLVEVEVICHISSVLVANPALFKLRRNELQPFVERIREAVNAEAEAGNRGPAK